MCFILYKRFFKGYQISNVLIDDVVCRTIYNASPSHLANLPQTSKTPLISTTKPQTTYIDTILIHIYNPPGCFLKAYN